MKKFFIFSLIALLSVAAQAQIVSSKSSRITVTKEAQPKGDDYNRLYFGFANYSPNGELSRESEINNFNGFKFGYLHGISLTKKLPLFLEVGGELQYGTQSESDDDEKWTYNLLSLNIPLNLSYKYSFSNGLYIAPYAGIGFRCFMLGNAKYTDLDTDRSVSYNCFSSDDMDGDTFKRFQVGGNFGVNVGYKAFNFNLGYSIYSPVYNDYGYKFKVNTFTVGIGFNF